MSLNLPQRIWRQDDRWSRLRSGVPFGGASREEPPAPALAGRKPSLSVAVTQKLHAVSLDTTISEPATSNSTGTAGSRRGSPVGGVLKRATDILLASIAIVVLFPLFFMVAALVAVSTGFPVTYSHERVGYGGRRFKCLKFRTMVTNSEQILRDYLAGNPEAAKEWEEERKLRHDPRVTFIGRMLRISSLDELPQLFNILMGDMSCVGPRPVTAEELERYGAAADDYMSARPGLTGLWQISGRNAVSYRERVRLDTKYVSEWSYSKDLMIMMLTPSALLRTRETS